MKKLLIAVAGLAIIIVAGVFFVLSNLDGIVKEAIQDYGFQATKTTISVADMLRLNLKPERLRFRDFM